MGKLLTVLRNISEVIAKVEDSGEVLTKIVKILARNLDVDVCSVYEYDKDSNQLVLTATCGLNPEAVGRVMMAPGKGLTGTCFKNKEIINIENPAKHPDYIFFGNTGEEKLNSYMGVPLATGGRVVGVLTLQRQKQEPFSSSVVDMARSLSPQMANLMLNAGMLRSLASDTVSGHMEKGLKDSIMLKGVAVNPGVARGEAFKFKTRDWLNEAEHETHNDHKKELELFETALARTRENTIKMETRALSMISEADASIFNAHLLFLEDKTILDEIKREIAIENHSLEFSIAIVFKRFEKKFLQLPDKTFRERLIDFKDVMLRLLESVKMLRNQLEDSSLIETKSKQWILAAHELMPSDLLRLPIDNLSGIVCEKGGVTSHVAILAKAFEIPALLGVADIMSKVNNYDEIILDCHAEKVYINPPENIKAQFDDLLRASEAAETKIVEGPAITADGTGIALRANISLICETSLLKKYGAEGIGLYRTEFLFMIRDYLPGEDIQYDVFSKVVSESNGDVTLRVLDVGGDKPLNYLNIPHEENPALGTRGIRLLMAHPDVLRTHLRAVLRAGKLGRIKILFPMISKLEEVHFVRAMLKEVEESLKREHIEYATDYLVGIMVEVPAVFIGLNKFIEYVDFVSIGTNDLQQYIFALERGNNAESASDCLSPVFLQIMADIGAVFRARPEKGVSVCGEMAGNPLAVPLLIGAGIKDFSMPAKVIPLIKKTISVFSEKECRDLLQRALKMDSAGEVAAMQKSIFAVKGLTGPVEIVPCK
ncbi:MAG: phosphoenolpyruvate--protein phosphotransferase [Victivallaceae bacterium]|jgi:phosphotransferase system enzyme I (PtsP)